MSNFNCPICKSSNCTVIKKDGKDLAFNLLPEFSKGELPHGALKVNAIRCHNCNYIWLKLTDSQADRLNQSQAQSETK